VPGFPSLDSSIDTLNNLSLINWDMVFLNTDQIGLIIAFGTLIIGIIVIWNRRMDGQREKGKEQERKEREEAEWVRDRVEAWDGYLGTAGVQSLGLYRHPPRDPSNLRVPEGRHGSPDNDRITFLNDFLKSYNWNE